MKTCPRCWKQKPLDEFAIDRSKASGRKSQCKACDRLKGRAYYRANRARVLARQKAYNRVRRAEELERRRRKRQRLKNSPVDWRAESRVGEPVRDAVVGQP